MSETWTSWLVDFQRTGDLPGKAFQEFLRYARQVAISKGEPSSYGDEGATWIGSKGVERALASVQRHRVDVEHRRHFQRLLGKIIAAEVASVRRRRHAARRDEDRNEGDAETFGVSREQPPVEEAIAREVAEAFATCVFSKGRTDVERVYLALGILKEYTAPQVREKLLEWYDKKDVPALRTIQKRIRAVTDGCLQRLAADGAFEP